MKKAISLILFFLLIKAAIAQVPTKYWVLFTDKNDSIYSIDSPSVFLSDRAIQRRLNQRIAIDETDLPVKESYIDSIKALGVQILNKSKWFNGISIATKDVNKVTEILKFSFVKSVKMIAHPQFKKMTSKFTVEEDEKVAIQNDAPQESLTTMDYGPSYYQADQIGMVCMHNRGFLGEGMVVAVIDAGFYKVDSLRVFDSLRINNQLLGTRDFVTGDTMVYEDNTHGMYVLSCMGGNVPGQIIGTAPKAKYWLLRSEDVFSETILEEVNWVAAAEFADSVGADVINSSLGYSNLDGIMFDYTYKDMDGKTTIISKAATMAARKGILLTSSAGNSGGAPWFKITAPADADSILTVGAVDSAGDITSFSSRGLTYDGRIKPNVVARGRRAVIADIQGGIDASSGTSFSSPITAGAVACLWQAHPIATNMQVLYAIEQSASQYANPDSIKGYGIPNFCVADSILTVITKVNEKGASAVENLNVFPNPFYDNFALNFYSDKKQTITISLFEISGRKVWQQDKNVNAYSSNHFYINEVTSLTKGIYMLRINTAEGVYTKKVVKQ